MSDYKKYVLSYFLNISKNRELSEGLTGLAVYKHISGGETGAAAITIYRKIHAPSFWKQSKTLF